MDGCLLLLSSSLSLFLCQSLSFWRINIRDTRKCSLFLSLFSFCPLSVSTYQHILLNIYISLFLFYSIFLHQIYIFFFYQIGKEDPVMISRPTAYTHLYSEFRSLPKKIMKDLKVGSAFL